MNKTTNKVQSDLLLKRMQEQPDIARGFKKENRAKAAKFWKQLTLELNVSGPPLKSEMEWKKVWTDHKRYVRKKVALKKMHEGGTGGRPNRTTEAFVQLVAMNEAVEGVGASPAAKRKRTNKESGAPDEMENTVKPEEVSRNDQSLDVAAYSSDCLLPPDPLRQSKAACSSNELQTPPRKSAEITSSEVVLKELEVQQELCAKVGEAVEEIKESNKEMQYIGRKIYRTLDRMQELGNLQLQEIKRHNLKMEDLRKSEIKDQVDMNRKMLELQQMQVDILREKQK